ncbi:serine/threonine protein kinase [Podospora conica]|nr:serine/threonine protein kinase [Schizothecium conicum]
MGSIGPPPDGGDAPVAAPKVDIEKEIEEGRDAYKPGGLHPVYIGDVYADKYEVMSKIGWGKYSTVWLVKDLSKGPHDEHRFRALKVLAEFVYSSTVTPHIFEREILRKFRDGDRQHVGYNHVCHLVDDFELTGPNGNHVCLVLELMGESLQTFEDWFEDEETFPTDIMKRFSYQLVCALGFAHENKVIHCDIKTDNIFVKMLDTSQIESGYLVDEPIPIQDRTEERYTPIESIPLRGYYFGGDLGRLSDHMNETIQADVYRAPEVLIEAYWSESTDLWNLGVVLMRVYGGRYIFHGCALRDGSYYSAKEHISEIVEAFGDFPDNLLWGSDSEILEEVFDGDGRLKEVPPFNCPDLASEYFLPGLDHHTRHTFASFLRAMTMIDPDDRWLPEQLLEHPWIKYQG